jgi:hypothetical protein
MDLARFVFVATTGWRPADGLGRQTTGDCVIWVLESASHSMLGRSGDGFANLAECRAAAARLQAGHQRVVWALSAIDHARQWLWQVDLDGQPVAVSDRSHPRMRECQSYLEQFLDAVPTARLTEGVRPARSGAAGHSRPPTPAATVPVYGGCGCDPCRSGLQRPPR